MDYVFVSYSRVDRELVKRIEEILQSYKLKYFLDEKDIGWGDTITESIEENLSKKASHIIVVISPASVKSSWVSYEIGFAKASGVKILPFLTHPSMEIPQFLASYNYISDLEQIDKYFSTIDEPEVKIIEITKEDGSKEKVELLICFEFNDNKNEYVVYTRNEINKAGNITVYVSRVDRSEIKPRLSSIPEEEWPRVKDVLYELAEDDTSRRWKNVNFYDANGIEIL